jgi:hypothetical protein
MKFEHYVKRATDHQDFKKFSEKHKKAYLSAGFFVLDYETNKNIHQIDFFTPGSNKIFTYKLEENSMQESKIPSNIKMKKPEKIDGDVKIDLDALKGIVHDEMLNRTITQEIKKIIAVLQQEQGKKVWKLNCITGDMGIIKVHIDDSRGNILEFEKSSLFDLIKKIK